MTNSQTYPRNPASQFWMELNLSFIPDASCGRDLLYRLEDEIARIQGQLSATQGSDNVDQVWFQRTTKALAHRKRLLPRLQTRIAVLERTEARDVIDEKKRKAFVAAAKDILPAETFTKIWTRALEMQPGLFLGQDSALTAREAAE